MNLLPMKRLTVVCRLSLSGDRRTLLPSRNVLRIVPVLLSLAVMVMTAASDIELAAADDPAFDLVIRQGRIVDGTGAPWYVSDLGVKEGKIVRIGPIPEKAGRQEIKAAGLVVAPGFIDMMGQTATPFLNEPKTCLNLLTQGITTINAGEGVSAAPLSAQEQKQSGWRTMREYFQLLEMRGLPINVAQTVGHTQVRQLVLGEINRRPSADELQKMRELVREGMEAGAIGLSTALIYPPAVFADTDEISALAAVAGEYGGRYYTHMRNEGDRLLEAIDEALEIGEKGKVPVHIFHLKAAGRANWGKMPLAIARIQAARAAGQAVAADIYPYINNGLGMASFIHPRHFGDGFEKLARRLDDPAVRDEIRKEMETLGGWENWFRHIGQDWSRVVIGQANEPKYKPHAGLTLAEIATATKEQPWDTFFQLAKTGAFVLPQSLSEANLILAMKQEFISFCTDVGPAGGDSITAHPRASGSFPKILSRYVRDLGVISLERAVAQASSVAANEILAFDRGRIAIGQAADLIIFDYDQIGDRATFRQPQELSVGMKWVVVNGVVALEDGKFTGKLGGKVLRGPGYRADLAPDKIQTGKTLPGMNEVDTVVTRFLSKYRLPGAAVAVTDQGRLVHCKGYGYADIGENQPVQPGSQFRIASVSKSITALIILQLIEQGQLQLDDRLSDLLTIEPFLEEGKQVDPRQLQITVRELLQHRGGWDRDKTPDPMFESVKYAELLKQKPPATADQIMRIVQGKPLDFAPGERYAYSNYGYCLLGRIIERKTGQSYEQAVRSRLLDPLKMTHTQLGKTRWEGRLPGEVRYYDTHEGKSVFSSDLGQRIAHPYGAWYLEAMDAHGGWVASASDLARLACALDDPEKSPLFKPATFRMLTERPPGLAGHDAEGKPKPNYYGLGFLIETDAKGRQQMHHAGSLPGTNTKLLIRSDRRNLVILLNGRMTPFGMQSVNTLTTELLETIERITEWPQQDLFAENP